MTAFPVYRPFAGKDLLPVGDIRFKLLYHFIFYACVYAELRLPVLLPPLLEKQFRDR